MPVAVVHAATLALDPSPLPPELVVAGDPEVGATELTTLGGVGIGVWEHGPGVSTDVEADEVFVVLAGRATVEVTSAEGVQSVLELSPGDVGLLASGARTRWTVHETFRKVYVVRS
jgi:uncharacterized protein